ncbi:MAG: PBSX family phage terminase large subunit [Candidatus Dormibacteraceae bacterium]
MSVLNIPTAEVFVPLLAPSRYKGARGGRGSGKSHHFAGQVVEEHQAIRGNLSVCIREVQQSLKQSAKRLIENKLREYNLGQADGFRVYDSVIATPGDGLIAFNGMQDHTAESIKSLEGFRNAWVEEAQTVSEHSLNLLRPTIRAPGSSLWFSWNRRRKSDAVEKLFAPDTPEGKNVVVANWNHNPWFPPELELERQRDLQHNPEQYDHIWEGDFAKVSAGAYFAKDLITAKREGRIGRVSRDPLMTVRAIWDIGGTGAKADACAIWIVQWIGKEIIVLDYYEAVGQPLSAHVRWLRSKGYEDALCILPHDGAQHDTVHDATYEGSLKAAGFDVKVIPNQGTGAAKQRIEAARRLFPRIWFNETTTEGGREALGHYHEKLDPTRQIGLGPEHDWSSHGADAFGLGCIAYEEPRRKADTTERRVVTTSGAPNLDWMSS